MVFSRHRNYDELSLPETEPYQKGNACNYKRNDEQVVNINITFANAVANKDGCGNSDDCNPSANIDSVPVISHVNEGYVRQAEFLAQGTPNPD